jgi:hypothetical protein
VSDLFKKTLVHQPKSTVGKYYRRVLQGNDIFSPDIRPHRMSKQTVEISKFRENFEYAGSKHRKDEDCLRFFNKVENTYDTY